MNNPWLMQGDCLDRMKEIPDGSVDAIITDPPYPYIKREYGYLNEDDWNKMMRTVISESRRILKPKGSAVFILQPNSEKIGKMRPWLWDFLAWTSREWNQIQDMWWWNIGAMPVAHSNQGKLTRPSLKACVWLGHPECNRYQHQAMWNETELSRKRRQGARFLNDSRKFEPSGHSVNESVMRSDPELRGGVTPMNVLPYPAKPGGRGPGHKHPGSTPIEVANWWIRYITKPGDVVCDPFMGAGTVPLEALSMDRKAIGIEKFIKYFEISSKRIHDFQNGIPVKTTKKQKTGTMVPQGEHDVKC